MTMYYRVRNSAGQYISAGWVYAVGDKPPLWTERDDTAPLVRAAVLEPHEAMLLQMWQADNGLESMLEAVR